MAVEESKIKLNETRDLEYGVLSIKLEGTDKVSLGCSDGRVRVLSLAGEESMEFDSGDQSVCLMHDTNETSIAACYSSGAVHVIDKETAKLKASFPKIHQFEVWFTALSPSEPDMVYSCSDDCSFKCLDTRTQAPVYTIKQHEAGVTWLSELTDHKLLTCSYDGTLRLWDCRTRKELSGLGLPGKPALWDVKSLPSGGIGIAAIYDGYFFSRQGSLGDLASLEFDHYTGHGSICYAFEPLSGNRILTTSFYDNTVQLLQRNN